MTAAPLEPADLPADDEELRESDRRDEEKAEGERLDQPDDARDDMRGSNVMGRTADGQVLQDDEPHTDRR